MDESPSPSVKLQALVKEAIDVSRKAKRSKKNLSLDNFYANKLADLRSEATNRFSELADASVGDISAAAELIETVFSATTDPRSRLEAARELQHALRTSWKQATASQGSPGNELFPLSIVSRTNRAYLITIAKQMNGCFREGWHDACAVMMRRLIEVVLIEAFEHQGVAGKAKNSSGDYVQLSELIGLALSEPKFRLSRNAKSELPKLRDIGHRSAHGRFFTAQLADVTKVEGGVRIVIEEFLNHAGLL
jgi:hypothetical protein